MGRTCVQGEDALDLNLQCSGQQEGRPWVWIKPLVPTAQDLIVILNSSPR